jgi:hypothetical protein
LPQSAAASAAVSKSGSRVVVDILLVVFSADEYHIKAESATSVPLL